MKKEMNVIKYLFKRNLILLFILLISITVFPKNKSTISGIVIGEDTKKGIKGASLLYMTLKH